MMVTTAKAKNARPNTGNRCRSGRNCDWLGPTRTFGVAAVCCLSLLALAFIALGFATSPADAGRSDYGGGADATLTRVLYNDAVFTAGVIIDDYMRARISTFFENR